MNANKREWKRSFYLRSFAFIRGLIAFALPVCAAIDGTVTNQTAGKPQGGATVTLYQLGQAGLDSIESVKSDASGKFVINRAIQGPHLLQTAFDGVTYNHMLPPGRPTTGLSLDVYNSTKQPGAARVTQHFVLFEPAGSEMAVTESFVFQNAGKTAYNDPDNGTLRVFVAEAGMKNLTINATAPQGMPIRRAPEKTKDPNVYYIDFPIKPGSSNIQLNYSLPFASGTFEGRVFYKGGGPTSLVAPAGVTIQGDGLESKGPEPRTKASIFQTTASSYKVEISGSGALRQPQAGEGEPSGGGGGGGIQQILPALYTRQVFGLQTVYWMVGLGMSILSLGFILFYRADKK